MPAIKALSRKDRILRKAFFTDLKYSGTLKDKEEESSSVKDAFLLELVKSWRLTLKISASHSDENQKPTE